MKLESFLSQRTKLSLLIIFVLLFGGLLMYGLIGMLTSSYVKWIVVGVFLYFLLIALFDYLSSHVKNRVITLINRLLFYPLIPIIVIIKIIRPFMYVYLGLIFLALICFVLPKFVMDSLNSLFSLGIEKETIYFCVLSFGGILSVYLSTPLLYLVDKTSFYKTYNDGDYHRIGIDLVKYLLNPKDLICLIYLLYFLYLLFSGFRQFQNIGFLISEGIDASILKSFLVFIAFSNLIKKIDEIHMEPTELFNRILSLIEA